MKWNSDIHGICQYPFLDIDWKHIAMGNQNKEPANQDEEHNKFGILLDHMQFA